VEHKLTNRFNSGWFFGMVFRWAYLINPLGFWVCTWVSEPWLLQLHLCCSMTGYVTTTTTTTTTTTITTSTTITTTTTVYVCSSMTVCYAC